MSEHVPEAKLPSMGYSDLERYLHVCRVNGVEPDEAKVRAIVHNEEVSRGER